MNRFRATLFLIVLALLAAPAFAETAPVVASLCPAPALSSAIGTPAPSFRIIPPSDYILCSCSTCKASPDIDCQVSPSGYSILCSDWYRLHC